MTDDYDTRWLAEAAVDLSDHLPAEQFAVLPIAKDNHVRCQWGDLIEGCTAIHCDRRQHPVEREQVRNLLCGGGLANDQEPSGLWG